MAEPLSGLRAIEFGQLLAGPFTGTLLGRLRRRRDQDRGAGRRRRDARLGPPAPQRPLAVVVDPGPQQALASRSTCASREGQRIAAELAATRRHRARELPPRHDGEVGARARGRPRAQPALRSTRACPATARPAATRTARASRPPARRSPACATSTATRTRRRRASGISLGDTLAAQSAFQGILLALYARERGAEGQVVDAGIVDACFAMCESATLEYEKTGFVREPTGPRLPRIAPSNVYCSSDGKWVVIAANHDTLWRRLAKIMGQPELGEDERFATHHARGEHEDLLDEIIGAFAAPAHGGGARRDHQRGRRRLRAGLHGEGRLRGPVLPRARAARGARGRGPRARDRSGGRAEAEPDARLDPPGRPLDGGRRHGRSAGGARSGRGGAQAPRGRRRDLKGAAWRIGWAWTSEGRSPTCSSSTTRITGSGA